MTVLHLILAQRNSPCAAISRDLTPGHEQLIACNCNHTHVCIHTHSSRRVRWRTSALCSCSACVGLVAWHAACGATLGVCGGDATAHGLGPNRSFCFRAAVRISCGKRHSEFHRTLTKSIPLSLVRCCALSVCFEHAQLATLKHTWRSMRSNWTSNLSTAI